MSFLVKAGRIKQLVNLNNAAVTVVRTHTGYWNKDFKPTPYPKTKEEREASAKKYNLLPEEYEPYPDDGTGYGDYPQMPYISGEGKDPYYAWDYPESKRNYGEPMHVYEDMMGEDRYNYNLNPRYSKSQFVFSFLGVVSGFALLYYIGTFYKMFRPVMIKQYPKDGVVHYTFEPAD